MKNTELFFVRMFVGFFTLVAFIVMWAIATKAAEKYFGNAQYSWLLIPTLIVSWIIGWACTRDKL